MTATPPNLAFLLGVPRSGTTLLSQLLAAHPEVIAPPEPWLLLALESFGRTPPRHPADSQLISLATEELLERIDARPALRALADEVYAQYLRNTGASCFVDKTPRYWLVLEFLETLYPEAPTFVLLRNPYAIAASLKTTWGVVLSSDADRGPQAPYIADLALGLMALLEHAERRPALLIRYEQLVLEPRQQQERALAHLSRRPNGLPEPGELVDNASEHTSFGDTKIRNRRLIDPSSLDCWQEQLDGTELRFITELLGETVIIRLGYAEELDIALRLSARRKGSKSTDASQRRWQEWLKSNLAVVRHGSSWPVPDGDRARRYDLLESQAAVFHESALKTDRLLRESNEDRNRLRAHAEAIQRKLELSEIQSRETKTQLREANRLLDQCHEHRQQLRVWAENAEQLLEECNKNRQQLRAWAEDAELRLSK